MVSTQYNMGMSSLNISGRSLLSFVWDELERDYLLEQNEKKLKERRKRVYTFFKTPQHLEKV